MSLCQRCRDRGNWGMKINKGPCYGRARQRYVQKRSALAYFGRKCLVLEPCLANTVSCHTHTLTHTPATPVPKLSTYDRNEEQQFPTLKYSGFFESLAATGGPMTLEAGCLSHDANVLCCVTPKQRSLAHRQSSRNPYLAPHLISRC